MENSIIFIFAAILIICLAVIFGFLLRLQTLLTATQTCKSQHETGHFSNKYPGGHVVWDNVSTRILVGFSL